MDDIGDVRVQMYKHDRRLLSENLLITRPACSQTKTPCGSCCSTRISVSLTRQKFIGANTSSTQRRPS